MKMILFELVMFLLLVPHGMSNRVSLRRSTMSLADDAGCQGRLDWTKFAKVNQVCEKCHSLFKELEVYKLCRYALKLFHELFQVIFVNFF